MLVEKYRPRSLDEIIGHKRIVESLRSYVRTKQMPNLLLVGKPGTGKTAIAYAMRWELGCGDDFIELNASDESSEYRDGSIHALIHRSSCVIPTEKLDSTHSLFLCCQC